MTSAATGVEVNFDGLPGPTHHFGGLAPGNLASARSAGSRSWPRRAALQSIAKMRAMLNLGLVQGVLPPHPRPHLETARRLGYGGSDATIVQDLARDGRGLLRALYSSSYMWVANAATVSAAADTRDGRIHFTTANLSSQLHRGIEQDHTYGLLSGIFANPSLFTHHRPLPCALSDEGAANHTRLATRYAAAGVSLFVYGRRALSPEPEQPALPARQTLEASRSVARQHRLNPGRVVFARQHPAAIDSGVFHNDVICVGNRLLLLVHEQAFEDQDTILRQLVERVDDALQVVVVPGSVISIERAVATYLFNSQLVSPPDRGDSQILVAPIECRDDDVVRDYLESLVADGTLSELHFLDLRESMHNGGGPACLRLRVVMSETAIAAVSGNVIATPELLDQLEACVDAEYPEMLDTADLRDPELPMQAARATAAIHRVLGIDPVGN